MGEQFVQFALSLAGVLAIIGCVHWLGFSRAGTIRSTEEARELFRLAAGGFEPKEIAVDRGGRGAIGKDPGGRLAVLVPHGNRFVARLLDGEPRLSSDGSELHIPLPSPGVADIRLKVGPEAAAWARQIHETEKV